MVIFFNNKISGNGYRGMMGGVGWLDYKNDIQIYILFDKYIIDNIIDLGF